MSRQLTAADLKATFDAFNRHDIDAVMTHFADDCVFFTVAGEHEYGNRIEGKDAIAKAFVGVWTAMQEPIGTFYSASLADFSLEDQVTLYKLLDRLKTGLTDV